MIQGEKEKDKGEKEVILNLITDYYSVYYY